MRNYVAVVFDDTSKAYEGLHALWQLDGEGAITVFGTTVVHRNEWGEYQVDSKETHAGLATAVGVGVGALLGALAGPAGAAVGATTDLVRADTRDQSRYETAFVVGAGQSAVIADVSEDWTGPIDTRMRELGGIVYRRSGGALRDDAWLGDYPPSSYLYPYEYIPPSDRVW